MTFMSFAIRSCSKLRFKFIHRKSVLCSLHSVKHSSLLRKNILNASQCTSILFAKLHLTAANSAKSFQEKENEYAHSIMENMSDYNPTVVIYPLKSSLISSTKYDTHSDVTNHFIKAVLNHQTYRKMSCEVQHLIFVYGTLKRGQPNHDLLQSDSEAVALFKGHATTVKKWPLVIASRYNIPYLLYAEGKGKHVIGEIYQVNEVMLSKMDELECHPEYYTRVIEEVEMLSHKVSEAKIVQPWIYFLKSFRSELLSLPHLADYDSKGSHGLEYVARYNRPKGQNYYSDVMNI